MKTRSQTLKTSKLEIKKETENDKSELTQLLQDSKNEMNDRKTADLEASRSNRVHVPNSEIKKEATNASTVLLRSKKSPWITQKQIKELIDYITKDKMTIMEAAKKVGMGYDSARQYHRRYRNDCNRKIPLPQTATQNLKRTTTCDQVKQLIEYIVKDKMSIRHAAEQVNMNSSTALRYYTMYRDDPSHRIPEPCSGNRKKAIKTFSKKLTSEKLKKLINCIVSGKMTVSAASKEVGISTYTAFKYYNRYLNDPERKAPVPDKGKRDITCEQVKTLIRCIVDDNMSITMASRTASMSPSAGKKYYKQYLDDPESCIQNEKPSDLIRKDRLKSLINLIFNEKLKVRDAAKKVGVSRGWAFKHYYRYLEDPSQYDFIPQVIFKDTNIRYQFSERLKKALEYIVNDKMHISAAAKKADVNRGTVSRYYQVYRNDPEHKIPKQIRRGLSKDKVKKLISYMVHDKMSLAVAAQKARISSKTARVYYFKYIDYTNHEVSLSLENKPKHDIPEELSQVFTEIHQKKLATEREQSQQTPTVKIEPTEQKVQR